MHLRTMVILFGVHCTALVRACRFGWLHKTKKLAGTAGHTYRYTLRLHRRLREIAGFRAATLPGLEHTLAVQSASGSAARGKCFTMKLTSEHRSDALRRSGVSAEQ